MTTAPSHSAGAVAPAESLADLSARATQGPVKVYEGQPCNHGELGGGGFTLCFAGLRRVGSGSEVHRIGYAADLYQDHDPEAWAEANIERIAALWNAALADPSTPADPTGVSGEEADRAIVRALASIDIEAEAEAYEFRADEGDHTPTENERALLIDFAHGLMQRVHDALRSGALSPPTAGTGPRNTLIDQISQEDFDAWDGSDEKALVSDPDFHPTAGTGDCSSEPHLPKTEDGLNDLSLSALLKGTREEGYRAGLAAGTGGAGGVADVWVAVPQRYVIAVHEFLDDWKKGDFSLCTLATLDAQSIVAAREEWAAMLAARPAAPPPAAETDGVLVPRELLREAVSGLAAFTGDGTRFTQDRLNALLASSSEGR